MTNSPRVVDPGEALLTGPLTRAVIYDQVATDLFHDPLVEAEHDVFLRAATSPVSRPPALLALTPATFPWFARCIPVTAREAPLAICSA